MDINMAYFVPFFFGWRKVDASWLFSKWRTNGWGRCFDITKIITCLVHRWPLLTPTWQLILIRWLKLLYNLSYVINLRNVQLFRKINIIPWDTWENNRLWLMKLSDMPILMLRKLIYVKVIATDDKHDKRNISMINSLSFFRTTAKLPFILIYRSITFT